MQQDGGLAHQDKVILDTSALDECALVAPNQLQHARSEPQGQQLGEGVHEADGPELLQVNGALGLGEQG
jgi:hypothetical protein